jgi:hypothetical protein
VYKIIKKSHEKNTKVIRNDTSFNGLEKSGLPPVIKTKTSKTIGIINNKVLTRLPVVE